MSKLYYTPPSEEIFNEVKKAAIKIWKTYDNKGGYVDDKVGRIKDIKNVSDNLMYIVAMFDSHNQRNLSVMISDEAREAISRRLKSGGLMDSLNVFFRGEYK